MREMIELLPIILGFFIAILYYLVKARPFKNVIFIVLVVLSGIFTNWVSREGIAFLFMDILMSGLSTVGFALIYKYWRRLHI